MNQLTQKQVLIFSGYNLRAVIALCRLLNSADIKAVIVARDSNDPIFKTSYADWVIHTRSQQLLSLELFELIRDICSQNTELVLMPTSEFLNRFALQHQKELEKLSIKIPLVDFDLYKKLSDKAAFRKLCYEHGLSVPAAVECDKTSIPFVAKQINFEDGGWQQAKPYLITTSEQLENFKQAEDFQYYFFEQYVDGPSVYLILYIGDTDTFAFSQQNLLQQAFGGSMIAASSSEFEHSETAIKSIQMLRKEGFTGLIMIEFRIENGEAYMIEANPRCWGPLQFCVDNSPILLWSFLQDCGILTPTSVCPDKRSSRFYLWTGGWKKDIANARQIYEHPGAENLMKVPLPKLLEDDIFCRPDTMSLFIAEITAECFT